MKITRLATRIANYGFATGVTLITGCASIVGGANQSVSVETRSANGQIVAGANCKLENQKGTWFVTTPGSVTVHRAYDDLSIYCTKEGVQPGIATIKSSTKGMAFGNILFGGAIGVGVDIATGAAYDYPPLITVELGKNATIKIPEPNKAGAPGTVSGGTSAPGASQAEVALTGSERAMSPSASGLRETAEAIEQSDANNRPQRVSQYP